MQATLTTKGQITLPKLLRENLHLRTGDKVIFEEQNGSYLLTPQTTNVKTLKGCVSYKGKPKTLEEMENAISNNLNI